MQLRSNTVKPVVVPRFHANAGVQAWYTAQLQDLLRQIRNELYYNITAAWKAKPPIIGFAQDAPSSSNELRKAMERVTARWETRLNALPLTLARKFALQATQTTDVAMRDALAKAGFTVQFQPTPGSVDAFQAVVAENVNLIKSIPQQYLKDVQTQVWQSVMRGGDLGTLTTQLQEQYGIGYRRAAFIARDQNNKAKAVMEEARRKGLGITKAVWRHSGGGLHPRPTHVAMSGKVYEISVGMWDSAIGKYVWPGSEPNCRCTSSAIIPGLEDD